MENHPLNPPWTHRSLPFYPVIPGVFSRNTISLTDRRGVWSDSLVLCCYTGSKKWPVFKKLSVVAFVHFFSVNTHFMASILVWVNAPRAQVGGHGHSRLSQVSMILLQHRSLVTLTCTYALFDLKHPSICLLGVMPPCTWQLWSPVLVHPHARPENTIAKLIVGKYCVLRIPVHFWK